MGTYTPDGGVVSSKLPRAGEGDGHRRMFGVYRGQVIKSVYPDDDSSVTKNRMEYTVRVKGQDYPNAINAREAGGIYNYKERIRKHTEKSFVGKLDENQYPENLDGEMVYVMFVDGNGDIPLIVGGDTHPRHANYKNPKRADGIFDTEEFNGVEVSIDSKGTYAITSVGLKDKDGKVQNQDAVGSVVKIDGPTGDITVSCSTDTNVVLTKKDKKIVAKANGNTVTMDSSGISLTDKNKNSITMASAGVTSSSDGDISESAKGNITDTAKGNYTASADGDATVTGKGSGTFSGKGGTNVGDSSSPTNVQGAIVNLAGGGVPVARLGDMVLGTGNLGIPVISQIMQGSPKVTSA